jgi:Peptidase family C25
MIKKLLFPLLLLVAYTTSAQLNNSWIDYSKTYYKFNIAADNICRIPQATLVSAGLTSTNADHFQLWRNGQQVRLFTTVSGTALGASDYIEFWGEMNDGKPDLQLYKKPEFQLADRYSLETDTATYFLTVNSAGGNLRYSSATNPAAGSAIPDAYFIRKIDLYYKNQINLGYGENAGSYVYSSSYDNGEGFTSNTISANPPVNATTPAVPVTYTQNIAGLNVYTAGPSNSLSVKGKVFFNTALGVRTYKVKVFNNELIFSAGANSSTNSTERIFNFTNQPLSWLTNTSNVNINLELLNQNPPPGPFSIPPIENMVIASLGISYPSTFNFNNQKSFYFELAASVTGNYLLIDNFNYGTVAPVLYDINNGRRYVGDISSTPGKVKFVLPASTDLVRKFILNNVESANINSVNNIASKIFVNYNTATTRGDYIIISNPILYNDGSGANKVEEYRAYRSSTNGGGYNAKIYDINELRDQFSFGIKAHPGAVRDFVRFMDQQYPVKPKFVFIIGRGLTYYDHRNNESNPKVSQLDLVPTFGWPSSDVCMVSTPSNVTPITPVGRIAAISGTEVGNYLQKVIQYEDAQRLQSPLIVDKGWMKNAMHVVGGRTTSESLTFGYYANGNGDPNVNSAYANILKDTLFGAYNETFLKTSDATIQQASSERITQLFEEGLGIISYFGHSSAEVFEFNLSNPEIYNSTGKYPFFAVSGCNAGNFYNFAPNRLTGNLTLSEKYTFAPQKGSIAFLASTHYGIPGDLDRYNQRLYHDISHLMYGLPIGNQLKDIVNNLGGNNINLFHQQRMHLEEINLQGDPALKVNNFPKPDFAIEPQQVKISPSIITVADASFNVKINMRNLGKATNDSMRVSVKRLLPNTTVPVIILDTMVLAIKNRDSLNLTIPINPSTDNGQNSLCIELDHTNNINEIYETNNKVCVDFFVFENTLAPVYPYNYAIVNTQNITFSASTANPLIGVSNFAMEIDTTELFNSPFKKTYNKTGLGGLIEFTPTNLTFTDSTVYYWRTAVIPSTGTTIWNNFSFVYLPTSSAGFNQSHYYQYLKNQYDSRIFLNADRKLQYSNFNTTINVSTGNFPPNDFPQTFINIGAFNISNWGRNFNTLQFIVLDGLTGNALKNTLAGSYGSNPQTISRINQFEFGFATAAKRKIILDFIDSMPNNAFIMMYSFLNNNSVNSYVNSWQTDPPSESLYNRLKGYGFTMLDSFYRNIPMFFKFVKSNPSSSFQKVGLTSGEIITAEIPINIRNTKGEVTSNVFGPAKAWSQFHWRGSSEETPTRDNISFDLIGINNTGVETTLLSVDSTMKDVDISFINAVTYPFIKIKLTNTDSAKGTPYQLRYWRLNYTPVPEGAVAPNIFYTMKDTVEVGEPINFSVAFKNISQVKFDSLMKIGLRIRTNNNYDSIINIPSGKVLIAGDTLKLTYTIPSEKYIGNNTLFAEFNPNNHQPEQYHFNNILYKNFFVKSDVVNPLLDVTFDGVHILNRDIVSAKPDILIKLKDESRFLALSDTGLLKVQLKFPGEQNFRNYYFNNDTMRFTPANLSVGNNTASINLKPFLTKDGEYELTVTGKDRSGNAAGALDYHTTFMVENKAMISELLNYPNPFTTSTAFVFTLTGSQLPQNLRIQILTITGKVVREITKAELGPIHIGRNITDFKWDGTDMYGQQLANGVYIYRVITNLNGKSLEKYKADGDNTSKYFNKGYGKMYLMR